MRIIHIIVIASLIYITSCRSARTVAAILPQNEPVTMVGVSPQPTISMVAITDIDNSLQTNTSNSLQANNETAITPTATISQSNFSTSVYKSEKVDVLENNQSKNIQSFAQVKAMAANGSLKLNNKQLKRLDKLDSKYHGDFNHFKSDIGDFSKTAKIIAAVGIIGLLLLLITGSAFGTFIFILAIGAFLCKWIGIIEF